MGWSVRGGVWKFIGGNYSKGRTSSMRVIEDFDYSGGYWSHSIFVVHQSGTPVTEEKKNYGWAHNSVGS